MIIFLSWYRAEKSRVAAQGRRDKEAVEMANLIDLLPYEPSALSKMDKNSLLELILNYLRMKQYLEKGKINSLCSNIYVKVCEI